MSLGRKKERKIELAHSLVRTAMLGQKVIAACVLLVAQLYRDLLVNKYNYSLLR